MSNDSRILRWKHNRFRDLFGRMKHITLPFLPFRWLLVPVGILLLCMNLTSCSGGNSCDSNQANNKMLALNKVVGKYFAIGGEGMTKFAAGLQTESGTVSELIAQEKYTEACAKVAELDKKYELNLAKEAEGMITMEQLAKDGGKGGGTCSVADAAIKQMELHGLLQKEVDAGRKSSDIFRDFNTDTRGYAEMLSTNPTEACELFDRLKKKYGV